jgi:hypothetical protein
VSCRLALLPLEELVEAADEVEVGVEVVLLLFAGALGVSCLLDHGGYDDDIVDEVSLLWNVCV